MLRRLSLPDGRLLLSIFDADLSSTDVPRGKPDPALFFLAAKALDVPPAQCVVLEDAPAGIAAARAGGMASVGIARLGDEALLQAAQADLVVTSLDQVDAAAVPDGIFAPGPKRKRPPSRATHDTGREQKLLCSSLAKGCRRRCECLGLGSVHRGIGIQPRRSSTAPSVIRTPPWLIP